MCIRPFFLVRQMLMSPVHIVHNSGLQLVRPLLFSHFLFLNVAFLSAISVIPAVKLSFGEERERNLTRQSEHTTAGSVNSSEFHPKSAVELDDLDTCPGVRSSLVLIS